MDTVLVGTLPEHRNLLTEESKVVQKELLSARHGTSMPSLHPGNLSISSEKKFIWYRVAKVATRTVYYHLKQHVRFDCDHGTNLFLPVNAYQSYFKFGFVRNPWDRLISGWRDKVVDKNHFELDSQTRKQLQDLSSFIGWLSDQDLETCDHHFRLQSRLIDLSLIDYLGRLETFDEDYQEICHLLSIPKSGLVHKNRSSREHNTAPGKSRSYRGLYSDALAETVSRLYQRDIQIFGYEF